MYLVVDGETPLREEETRQVLIYSDRRAANVGLAEVLYQFPNAEIIEVKIVRTTK